MDDQRSSAAESGSMTPQLVDAGDGWHIDYDPLTDDYNAYIGSEYIGSRAHATAARPLCTATLSRHIGCAVVTT